MTMDNPTFRLLFPEFSNTTTFTDAQVNLWLGMANTRLDGDLWGNQLDYGTALFVAHNLALGQINQKSAAVGGKVGEVKGAATGKSVENASTNYDASFIKLDNLGFWGLTTYGLQFFQLSRQFAVGLYV